MTISRIFIRAFEQAEQLANLHTQTLLKPINAALRKEAMISLGRYTRVMDYLVNRELRPIKAKPAKVYNLFDYIH